MPVQQQEIHEQQRTEHRDQRVQHPPRERIPHALPHDQAEIEQAVTQDGVGEGCRHRQEHQREHRERAGGEDVGARLQPVPDDRPRAGGHADDRSDHQHADAAAIGERLGGAAVRHQHRDGAGRIRDVDQQDQPGSESGTVVAAPGGLSTW